MIAAGNEAFMAGLHSALLVAAVISFIGAALAMLVERGMSVEPGIPARV